MTKENNKLSGAERFWIFVGSMVSIYLIKEYGSSIYKWILSISYADKICISMLLFSMYFCLCVDYCCDYSKKESKSELDHDLRFVTRVIFFPVLIIILIKHINKFMNKIGFLE